MAFTTTWSFGSSVQSWTFEEVVPIPPGAASRSHVSGAIRVRLQIFAPPPTTREVHGFNTSALGLNGAITGGDTAEADISATSDAVNMSTRLTAVYTDETSDSIDSLNNNNARTLTLNLTGGKTLDYIQVRFRNSTNVGTIDHTRDLLEVRLTTATEITATAGKLRTPATFIEDEGVVVIQTIYRVACLICVNSS